MPQILRKRKDKNQKEIVNQLKSIGCSVADLSNVGSGIPDILVGFRGRNFLFEIKTRNNSLNPLQISFFQTWSGNCYIVRSFNDCLNIFKSF